MELTDLEWECLSRGGGSAAPTKSEKGLGIVFPRKTEFEAAKTVSLLNLSAANRLYLGWHLRGGTNFSYPGCDKCGEYPPVMSMTISRRKTAWESVMKVELSRLGGSVSVPLKPYGWQCDGARADSSESSSVLFKNSKRECHVGLTLSCQCSNKSKVVGGDKVSILVVEKFSAW